MKRRCKKCGKRFYPRQWNHIFCGSKTNKTGCSWFNVTVTRSKRRWQDPNYKEYQKEYGKRWKKTQRFLNTDYAVRQLRHKMNYYYNGGKEVGKKWRKKNIDKILFWNKKRTLAEKSVIGSHTWYEWQELKRSYKKRCAICKINEDVLRKKWGNKFSKLTEDHIIPISKGGY
ncbi:MAG TPA: hypothetical protein VJC04_03365 [Candidatus Paceibacterota bacterium]